MISNEDAQSLIQASFYFNELFKRTIVPAALPVPVTKTQMDILMALYSEGPMNMSTLSAKVYIAPEQATRAIHGLRENGLIVSERSEENRRMVIAHLTDNAILMLDDHVRELNMTLQANLDGLSDEEIKELVQAASTVVKLSQKNGHQICDAPTSKSVTICCVLPFSHALPPHRFRSTALHHAVIGALNNNAFNPFC